MFERAYRQRLESDLARWQTEGLITPTSGDAIRRALGPIPMGVNVATVVGLAGGLLIAAAFLAFVAANWAEVARPARFGILLAGIAGAYALAGWFHRKGRTFLADAATSVGCIVFGAAIALVGQMYHLDGDFAGALLLWAAAALIAAAFTGSRGAFAIALVVGCLWSGTRVEQDGEAPHFAFVAFWLLAAMLPVVWDSTVARHLVAVAALAWWFTTGFGLMDRFGSGDPTVPVTAGICLVLGTGLALASAGPPALRALGVTLSTYSALAFVLAVAWRVGDFVPDRSVHGLPWWVPACALVGVAGALGAATMARKAGPALAGLSMVLGLAVVSGWTRPPAGEEPFMTYAVALIAMVSLVASGMLDEMRPRIVAGWIGLATAIAAITWAVQGSLLQRSMFLAAAGLVTIAIANLLGRMLPRESAS